MDALLLGPITQSEDPKNELDDRGESWGFSHYAELTIDPSTPVKALHDFMRRWPWLKWFVAKPLPMYRIPLQRVLEASKAGAMRMTDKEVDELLDMWLKK